MKLVEGVAHVADLEAFLADLDAVADEYGCTVQAFDARYLVGREHLRRAVELADRAFEREENVARDRGVEILLYAAGRRQIDQSLELGVAEGDGPVVVLVDDPDDRASAEDAAADAVAALLEPADTLGAYDEERVCAFFDVDPAEREAVAGDLSDLVLERVALLDVEK
ncbi:MAG: KEOPS complex subunit Cgi121 [Haloferacaceae archaeon]